LCYYSILMNILLTNIRHYSLFIILVLNIIIASPIHDPITYSYLNVETGNFRYPGYAIQKGYYGLKYGLINYPHISYSISIGLGTNTNTSGQRLTTTPIDISIFQIHQATKRLNLFYGLGFGLTSHEHSTNTSGTNLHLLFGSRYKLSANHVFTFEFKKYYLFINSTNFESNLLKFGVSVNLY